MYNKPRISRTSGLMLFPVTAVACVICQEVIARQSLAGVVSWIWTQPVPFALNVYLSMIPIAVAVALVGRIIPGLAAGSLLLLLIALVNAGKLSILKSPFFAWDMFYFSQMATLVEALVSRAFLVMAAVIALLLALLAVWLIHRNRRILAPTTRIGLTAVAVAALSLFYWQPTHPPRHLGIQNIVWEQAVNYDTNGFLLAFSMNISPLLIRQPDAYGRLMVEGILRQAAPPATAATGYKGQPVSLVVFISESFSDLDNTPFKTSDDVLKNFNRLIARYPHFQMVSPTFAGCTSLVEYEVLTGLANAFLPPGAIPFDHYLQSRTPSLVWTLRRQGYRTTAIHPFHDWFWNRKTVYPNLGFEKFISLTDFSDAPIRGSFVSDAALVDKIIDEIGSSDGPFFIHAISMQNHGPYTAERYTADDDPVRITGEISDWLRTQMETYLTGLRDADRELGRLVDFLGACKKPVICLFFGDHQPDFSAALFSTAGTIQQGTALELQLARVPGLIWSNRKDLLDSAKIPAQLSTFYLPAILLDQMGIPLPGHMAYLRHVMAHFPVIHRYFTIDAAGNLARFTENRNLPYVNEIGVLNYDMLFGSRYSHEDGDLFSLGRLPDPVFFRHGHVRQPDLFFCGDFFNLLEPPDEFGASPSQGRLGVNLE